MGNNEVRIEKLLDSIPYYTNGAEEYDVTLHRMKHFDIKKLKYLQSLPPHKMHYQVTVLHYDGYSIRSYSWQYLENENLVSSIMNVMYETAIHGAMAVILKFGRNDTPNISMAVW